MRSNFFAQITSNLAHMLVTLFFLLSANNEAASQKVDVCESPRIDAIIWTHKENKVLLFVDNYFWEYDSANKNLKSRKVIYNYWPHVKTPISAATTVFRGKGLTSTYFIKENKYWRYDNNGKDVLNARFIEDGTATPDFGANMTAVTIINGILGEENTEAVLCGNSDQIYFCNANYDKRTLVFNTCSSLSVSQLPEGSCTSVSKDSDKTYLIVGRDTMIQSPIGTIRVEEMVELLDLFRCGDTTNLFLKIMLIGLIPLILVTIVLFAICNQLKKRQEVELNRRSNEMADETSAKN